MQAVMQMKNDQTDLVASTLKFSTPKAFLNFKTNISSHCDWNPHMIKIKNTIQKWYSIKLGFLYCAGILG